MGRITKRTGVTDVRKRCRPFGRIGQAQQLYQPIVAVDSLGYPHGGGRHGQSTIMNASPLKLSTVTKSSTGFRRSLVSCLTGTPIGSIAATA